MNTISESLIDNSKSAIIGCVELHNKPIFPYRYEICVILAINGWELLLKAFIAEYHPNVKLIKKDKTTKSFEECLAFVSSQLGKDFLVANENLSKLYDYRCHIIHFYKSEIDSLVYALLHKSIMLYNSFLKQYFNFDLADETNLMLLPIGFKPFATPVDFLSKNTSANNAPLAVQTFVNNIIEATTHLFDNGVEDSILTGFNIAAINENRIKNADIIAGITKDKDKASLTINNVLESIQISDDETVKKIAIEEETLFKTIYTLKFYDVVKQARELYSDFKQNAKFNKIIKEVKTNPSIHRKRFLDVVNKSGVGQDYYSPKVFEVLNEHYTLKSNAE